jgi:hypothetical protein
MNLHIWWNLHILRETLRDAAKLNDRLKPSTAPTHTIFNGKALMNYWD